MVIIIITIFFIFVVVLFILNNNNKKNNIDDIYLINLKKRKDRLEYIKRKYNLEQKLIIYEAINGELLNLDELQANKMINETTLNQLNKQREYHYELTHKGSIGCYLTHFNIWKENKKDIILIFEDDTEFNNINIEEINNRINKLPNDWDIYLLSDPDFCYSKIDLSHVYKDLYQVKRFFLLNAYLINKRAIQKIIKSNTIYPIIQQLDSYLSELTINFKLNIYVHNKSYKYYDQNKRFTSDIQIDTSKELSYKRLKLI